VAVVASMSPNSKNYEILIAMFFRCCRPAAFPISAQAKKTPSR
jgi:hypothetical protein